ncbi:uncharacterized protein KZ484_014307 [Pholidichthys leucotaenia]
MERTSGLRSFPELGAFLASISNLERRIQGFPLASFPGNSRHHIAESPLHEPRPDPVLGHRRDSSSHAAVTSSPRLCGDYTAPFPEPHFPAVIPGHSGWLTPAVFPSSSTRFLTAVCAWNSGLVSSLLETTRAILRRIPGGSSVIAGRGEEEAESTTAGDTQPPGGRQVIVFSHLLNDLLCHIPGEVQGSQLPELSPPAVTCIPNPASSVSLSAERSPAPGQRGGIWRGPVVPQLHCGRRRGTDCCVESTPTTERPRVSTEERFGPAGRDSSGFTPSGSSAGSPEPEESQAALTIVLAAGPDAARWEPDNDLTTDPGSSQSWTASEPEIRQGQNDPPKPDLASLFRDAG